MIHHTTIISDPICYINGEACFPGDTFMGQPVEYWVAREDEALQELARAKRVSRITLSCIGLVILLVTVWFSRYF
jgi:hypothetical protein